MKRLVSLSLIIVVLLMASCAKKKLPAELVQAYLEAHNDHSPRKASRLFSDTAKIILEGQPPVRDIRLMEEWDSYINSNLYYEDWSVQGNKVIIGKIIEKNDWFASGGVTEIVYEPGTEFITYEGEILEIRVSAMTPKSANDLNRMFTGFTAWLNQNRPGMKNVLLPNGNFSYTKQSAERWIEMLTEWRQSKAKNQ